MVVEVGRQAPVVGETVKAVGEMEMEVGVTPAQGEVTLALYVETAWREDMQLRLRSATTTISREIRLQVDRRHDGGLGMFEYRKSCTII
jgi:hypothetical protein